MAKRVASPDEAAAMQISVAAALIQQRHLPEAIDVLRESTTVLRQTLGVEHTRTLAAMNNLGGALSRAGKDHDAEAIQREILAVRRKLFGAEHFDVAVALYNLGETLEHQGQYSEAEQA